MYRTIVWILILSLTSLIFAQKSKPSSKKEVSDDFVIKEKVEQEWNEGKWANYKKSIFKYTKKDRLVEKIEKLWVKTVWATSCLY